jgi:hypothetical protein
LLIFRLLCFFDLLIADCCIWKMKSSTSLAEYSRSLCIGNFQNHFPLSTLKHIKKNYRHMKKMGHNWLKLILKSNNFKRLYWRCPLAVVVHNYKSEKKLRLEHAISLLEAKVESYKFSARERQRRKTIRDREKRAR